MRSEVIAVGHLLHTKSKLLEGSTLCGPQRVLPEKRDHDPKQVRAPVHVVGQKVLPMVVMAGIRIYRADPKEGPQRLQALDAARALCHDELVC